MDNWDLAIVAALLLGYAGLSRRLERTVLTAPTVGLSVFAHGLTALPLTDAYARWFAAHDEPPPMESADAHEHRLRRPQAGAAAGAAGS